MLDRAIRIDLEMPVELSSGVNGTVSVGHSVNISETGMLVFSEQSRPRGTVIRFEVGPRFKGSGEVIWMREAEEGGAFLGLKFQPLRRDARRALMGLLQAG